MAYDLLNKLKNEGSLAKCSITVSDKSALRKHRTLFGRDISRISTSRIEFRGGETGYENMAVPLDSVQEIRLGDRMIFRKKKRIERIYPR